MTKKINGHLVVPTYVTALFSKNWTAAAEISRHKAVVVLAPGLATGCVHSNVIKQQQQRQRQRQRTVSCMTEKVLEIKDRFCILFFVIVIVIMISAMFTFKFCPKLQDKHCKSTMTMMEKNKIHAPSKVIYTKYSKQFKWNSYFYVSGQNRPFWAALKLL